MDSKKLIGMILGVIAFVALIAGATFAWLTITASVTNGVLNIQSRNFVIDYNKGTDISGLPILSVANASAVAESGAKTISVTAKLHDATNPPGALKLTLIKTADAGGLVSSGVIKYATKIGTGTPTAPQTVTADNQELVLSGTNTTTETINSTTNKTITVYFWLDAAAITESMMGQTYSGYIKATATQLE